MTEKDKTEFLGELFMLMIKHGISLSHEDKHGSFQLTPFNLKDARWLSFARAEVEGDDNV